MAKTYLKRREIAHSLQEDLVNILKKNGAMTRDQMISLLERPRTTIYDNLSILIDQERVKSYSRQVNDLGRPVVFFKLRED